MNLDAIRFARLAAPSPVESSQAPGESPGGFGDLLKQGFEKLDQLEDAAADQTKRLLAGEPVELHRVVLANEEAGLAFDLMMSVRNKVVDAYQEVMRMQV